MKYNRLGNTGLLTTDLALGTMIFGEQNERGTPEAEALQIIDRYLDAGGNHLDTANVYAGGRSEEIVGKALKNRRHNVIVATKVRFPMGSDRNEQGLSRQHIIQQAEASLRRLQTDYIDLYYMHAPDPLTPIAESLRAFDDLVTSGKVRYIGVSNFKAWQLMKALAASDAHGYARFAAAQYQYSLVKRDIEYEFADLLLDEGVGLTSWGALGGGFLSGKYKRDEKPTVGRIATTGDETEEAWERRSNDRNWAILDALGTIAEARNVTYSQVALAWVRAQPMTSSVIIGVRTLDQLTDNLAAADLALTADELMVLNHASTLPELYPYRMIDTYAQRKV